MLRICFEEWCSIAAQSARVTQAAREAGDHRQLQLLEEGCAAPRQRWTLPVALVATLVLHLPDPMMSRRRTRHKLGAMHGSIIEAFNGQDLHRITLDYDNTCLRQSTMVA